VATEFFQRSDKKSKFDLTLVFFFSQTLQSLDKIWPRFAQLMINLSEELN
jgi:hypothetical protein